MHDTLHAEPAFANPAGAGLLLREARQASGMSIADIAATTRISREFLTGLEAGQIAEDLAPVYAIGYARAYARMVGVPEEVAADDVRQIVSHRTPRPARPSIAARPRPSAGRLELRAGIGIIAAAAGALLIALQFVPS